jgi:hypothetical protein
MLPWDTSSSPLVSGYDDDEGRIYGDFEEDDELDDEDEDDFDDEEYDEIEDDFDEKEHEPRPVRRGDWRE